MKEIQYLIESISVASNRVTVVAEAEFTKKFLNADFFVEYQESSILKLPEEVLLAPFLYNIAPIVWLSGKTYKLKTCDSDLYQSLLSVREVMAAQYPLLDWAGGFEVDELVSLDLPIQTDSAAVLFSGGLDSITTSLRHKDKKQLLLAVQGADVGFDNESGWKQVQMANDAFAKRFGFNTGYIKANLIDFINTKELLCPEKGVFNWWGCVQFGMGLCGVAMPLIVSKGIPNLLIGSSYSVKFNAPNGSTPEIDNKLRVGAFRSTHDAFEWSRQDKISFVVTSQQDVVNKTELRVCHAKPGFGDGGNCGKCEKCLRTMCGLAVEGARLKDWGFNVDVKTLGQRLLKSLDGVDLMFGGGLHFLWKEIQSKAKSNPEFLQLADPIFYQWFVQFDFNEYLIKYKEKPTVPPSYFQLRVLPPIKRLIASNKYTKSIAVFILSKVS